jgi:hypothetical protein
VPATTTPHRRNALLARVTDAMVMLHQHYLLLKPEPSEPVPPPA